MAALTAGPGDHQRGVGRHVRLVQRFAARGARRAGAAGAVGGRVAAGARPRADPAIDHQVGGHRAPTRPRPARWSTRPSPLAAAAAPRPGVPRLPARRVRPVGGGRARRSTPPPRRAPSRTPTQSPGWPSWSPAAERPAFLVGSDVYWAGAVGGARRRRRAPAGAVLLQRPRPGDASPPTTSWRSCGPAGVLKQRRRPRRRARDAARLPARLRPLRRGHGGARRRRRVAAGGPRRRADGGRRHRRHAARRWPATAGPAPTTTSWIAELRDAEEAARGRGGAAAGGCRRDPIKPTRVYGELRQRLEPATPSSSATAATSPSYAGKYVEVFEPGLLAGHRPVRLPRQRAGLRDRRPGRPGPMRQIVVLLGDGAAGFSLMDADSLVRHGLPVVMVVGNNGMWGLEKHPMQAIYGWDVACDLQPGVPLRRGRHGPRRRRRDRDGAATRSAPRSTGRSPAASRTSSTSSPTPPTSTPAAPTSADVLPPSGRCRRTRRRRRRGTVAT